MSTVTITAYQFKIKQVRENVYFPLNDFNGGLDILNEFNTIISSWGSISSNNHQPLSDEDTNKALLINNMSIQGRTIEGTANTGDYGFERTNYDVTTGLFTGTTSIDEASTVPFKFIIHAPRNRDTGILLSQRFNHSGMYGIFTEQLAREFKERNEGYILIFEQLISRDLANEWLNGGSIKSVIFTSADSRTIANAIINTDNTDINIDDFKVELRLVAKRNRSAISRLFMSNRMRNESLTSDSFRELLAVNGFDRSDVKIQVRMAGKQRTFRAENLSRMGAFLDITNEVDFDPRTGLPLMNHVRREMRSYLSDLSDLLYGTEEE